MGSTLAVFKNPDNDAFAFFDSPIKDQDNDDNPIGDWVEWCFREKWRCENNIWDDRFSSCDVAEETVSDGEENIDGQQQSSTTESATSTPSSEEKPRFVRGYRPLQLLNFSEHRNDFSKGGTVPKTSDVQPLTRSKRSQEQQDSTYKPLRLVKKNTRVVDSEEIVGALTLQTSPVVPPVPLPIRTLYDIFEDIAAEEEWVVDTNTTEKDIIQKTRDNTSVHYARNSMTKRWESFLLLPWWHL